MPEQAAEAEPASITKPRSNRRWWVLAGLVLVVAGAGIGIGLSLGTGSSTETVHGQLQLTDFNLGSSSGPCSGSGGYSDLTQGAQILVENGAGATIATGTLGAGNHPAADPQGIFCDFPFTVSVPANATFYQFKIGTRGGPSYSLDQMKQMNWNVGLAIGH
jgi:hypothetical protein